VPWARHHAQHPNQRPRNRPQRHNGEWTASETDDANCGTGERLLRGGITFTNPGNREVGVLEALPISNPTGDGVIARITTDSGGTAAAEVVAMCLK
jgi:hypothetical protein